MTEKTISGDRFADFRTDSRVVLLSTLAIPVGVLSARVAKALLWLIALISAAERKTLLVAGAAGGMSAIFATPVAAVLLAVELLLFEWKPRSFIPVAIASVTASVLRVPLLGAGPIFPVTPHAAWSAQSVAVAFTVGIAVGLGSCLLTSLVYACEDLFQRLPVHWMWWPAIGAAVVGLGGVVDPRVLGVGYETIHALMRGQILGGD